MDSSNNEGDDGLGKMAAALFVGAVFLFFLMKVFVGAVGLAGWGISRLLWGISRLLSSSSSSDQTNKPNERLIHGYRSSSSSDNETRRSLRYVGAVSDSKSAAGGSTKDSAEKVTWKGPPIGEYMLNTDGSVNPDGAGYGAIIRDWKGDLVCAVAGKSEPPGSILLHELEGVEAGLKLAIKVIPFGRIHIGSDREEVVRYFNSPPRSVQPDVWETWENIKVLRTKIRIGEVKHNPRETNKVADELSKVWRSEGLIVLEPPIVGQRWEKLLRFIQEDKQGMQQGTTSSYY